jgi:hypothetical protein
MANESCCIEMNGRAADPTSAHLNPILQYHLLPVSEFRTDFDQFLSSFSIFPSFVSKTEHLDEYFLSGWRNVPLFSKR